MTITLPDAGNLTVGGDGKVTGSFSIDSSPIAQVLDSNLSNVRVSYGGITLGTLVNNVQAITYTAGTSAASAKTTISTDTIINGELIAKEKLTLTSGNTSAYLDVDQVGKLSQLLNSTIAGQKTVIDAGDGSKVGGVEFNAGAVTGVKSINGDDQYAKFRVTEDDSSYTFRAGNFQVTTGKENGVLNGEITFADTNRPNKSDEITLSEIIATRDKTDVIANSKTSGSENYESTKIRDVLEVRNDGKVNIDGTLTAKSGSKIGNITIDGGQLVAPLSGGTDGEVRVNVTDLYNDHKIITEDTTNTYSSKNIKLKIDSLEQSSTTIGSQIQKIERFTNQNDGREGTSIAGNLDVYDDGTVIINYNQAQQVTIDSNGIKVGAGSAYINNEGFKAGADGKNSLTITGLTAKEIRAGNDNTEFFVDGGGNVVAAGTLNAAGGKFDVSAEGNITASGSLSVAGDKFRVNADGSINANNKFIVGADGALRASDDKFTADNEGNVRAIGSLSAAGDKFQVGADGSINVNQKFIVNADGTISSEGTLSAAGGNFSVDADGALKAANNNFSVDKEGKLISASGSQIGGVTIDGEKLSNGTKSITVSDLATDHTLVTDADKGNESLYNQIGYVQDFANGLDDRTGGIQRVSDPNDSTKHSTLIEGVFLVDNDGTARITNGFKVGADDKNSLTTSGLTAKTIKAGTDNDAFIVEESGNVIAKGDLTVAGGELYVGTDGDITTSSTLSVAGNNFTVDADGALKAANNNFSVDKDGALKAANNNFSVDKDGKLMSANGSKIGGVTIDGEKLSAGTASITVSQLEKDNELVNDATKGNESLYTGLGSVQTLANSLDTRTAGISRDTTGTAATTIEGKLQVSSDGTVKINEGDAQQVIIDSNGIKVGTGSAYINNDGFKAGADGKNSLTTSGLTAKTIKAGTDNDAFTVDENGNVVASGSLSAVGGKFSVDADGALKAANNSFSVDKDGNIAANGTLSVANGKFQIDASGVVTAGSMKMDNIEAADTSKGVTVGGVNLKDKTISAADDKFTVDADGALKAANNNFSVDKDGALKAANNNFSVDKDGKLISASGSQIGGVTIDGESLSNGTKSINVSELKDDHDLVNDSKKGNESLYTGLGSVQTLANSLDTRTAGISRDTTGTAATTIEGKLKVSSDGAVKINEGDAQQVIIDSNGIKVGTGSAYINNDGFKAGADGNNSLTTSGLTAKTIKAGTNNDAFVVDENGNVVANGALKAANGAFSVDISGNVITSGYVRLNSGANSTQLSAGGIKFIKDGTTTTIEGETVTVSSSGVNKSFNLSDIADVGQNMTSLGNRIDTVQKNVDAEAAARQKDVQDLNTAISKETTERQQDVKDLNDAISKETTERQQDVKNLNDAISKETTERQQDVKNLNDAISKETTERQQDVKNLNDALSKETTERQQDVKNLNDALSKETADRQQDVKNLNDALSKETTDRQQDVKNLNDALSKETTERQQDVKRLDTAISDEAAARQKDVADLNGRVDTVNNRVDDVQKNVDAEAAARQKDVADLNGRVDTVNSRVDNISNDFNTAINDEKTKREQDVADLNGRVDTVNSRVDNISNDFNTAINDEKTKREQEVTRLDGRIDTVSTNLGDLNDLDGDLKSCEEYTKNSSVVGGINAEAAVRKEEVTRLDTAIADEAAARQADVARLDGRISDVSSRINKVGAMAAAISSLKTMGYDPESPTEFSIGLGQYKGETGVALGFFHYPNKNFMLNVSLSTSSGEIMGGIGATWRFGHKSPQKLLDEQREAQVKKEIAAAEAYKAARAARSKDAK